MGRNSDKISKVFCINICCFSTRFYIFVPHGTVIQVSSKLWLFLIFTPHKTRTFTVRLAVGTTKYQGNGFAAELMLGRDHPRVVPCNRSHRKRSYSISNIGNIMGCDHQSCVVVGPFAGELWHFEYFPTTTVRQLLIFHHMTVTVVQIWMNEWMNEWIYCTMRRNIIRHTTKHKS